MTRCCQYDFVSGQTEPCPQRRLCLITLGARCSAKSRCAVQSSRQVSAPSADFLNAQSPLHCRCFESGSEIDGYNWPRGRYDAPFRACRSRKSTQRWVALGPKGSHDRWAAGPDFACDGFIGQPQLARSRQHAMNAVGTTRIPHDGQVRYETSLWYREKPRVLAVFLLKASSS